MRKFSTQDFLKLLASNELQDEIVIEGMVKVDEEKQSVVLLSVDTSCEDWLPVPQDMIETIEYVSKSACKDHQHPYVRIYLKEPAKDNFVAQLFLKLYRDAKLAEARASAASEFAMGTANRKPVIDIPHCPSTRGPCERQPDGSYKQWERNIGTGCVKEWIDCTPPAPPKQIKVTYAGHTCTRDGNPKTEAGSNFQITGSMFVPRADCSVLAIQPGGFPRGAQATKANDRGEIFIECFWAAYPGPGVFELTFLATDLVDGGVGIATHSP